MVAHDEHGIEHKSDGLLVMTGDAFMVRLANGLSGLSQKNPGQCRFILSADKYNFVEIESQQIFTNIQQGMNISGDAQSYWLKIKEGTPSGTKIELTYQIQCYMPATLNEPATIITRDDKVIITVFSNNSGAVNLTIDSNNDGTISFNPDDNDELYEADPYALGKFVPLYETQTATGDYDPSQMTEVIVSLSKDCNLANTSLIFYYNGCFTGATKENCIALYCKNGSSYILVDDRMEYSFFDFESNNRQISLYIKGT